MLEAALGGGSSQVLPLGGKRMLALSFYCVEWTTQRLLHNVCGQYVLSWVFPSAAQRPVKWEKFSPYSGNIARSLGGVCGFVQKMEGIPVFDRVNALKQLSHLPYLLHRRPCMVWVVAQHPQPCKGHGSTRWLMISALLLLFSLLFPMCLHSGQSLLEVAPAQNVMTSLFFTWLLACGTLEADDLHNLP